MLVIIGVLSFVRYSEASITVDSNFFLGAIIFLIICGVFIFQNNIWEEQDYEKNKKWIKWKNCSIKSNKADLSKIYPGINK